MNTTNLEALFVKFIISPEYKWLRHLTLICIIFIMTFTIFINNPISNSTWEMVVKGVASYFFPLITIIYLHIYIGINRYLLNNRYPAFIIFTVSGSLLYMLTLLVLLFYYVNTKNLIEIDSYFFYINIINSFVIIFLILTGVTGIILFKNWVSSSLKTDQLESEGLQSELTYLSTQINPHFLFNMLNNAHVLIKENKGNAAPILNKLEELLKYQITQSSNNKTLLSREIQFLEDYLTLEKIRRDNFNFRTDLPTDMENRYVPPLLFIPFVENAVKHSQDSDNESFIEVIITINNSELTFVCINSKPKDAKVDRHGGLGLKNIQRRLKLLYGKTYTLNTNENKTQYKVTLIFPLT